MTNLKRVYTEQVKSKREQLNEVTAIRIPPWMRIQLMKDIDMTIRPRLDYIKGEDGVSFTVTLKKNQMVLYSDGTWEAFGHE